MNAYSDRNINEAFEEALNGEQRIFANPTDLIRKANVVNETYLAEVRALKKYLAEQENLLVNTINSNNNVGKRYMEAKAKVVAPSTSTVVIEED